LGGLFLVEGRGILLGNGENVTPVMNLVPGKMKCNSRNRFGACKI
jgi:hypothetical protein